jgi:outer membrane beta-barrel protein
MYKSIIFSLLSTCIACITFIALPAYAQNSNNLETNVDDNIALDKIITPDLERRVIREDKLDNEDWEIGAYVGLYSIEDFGTNSVTGIRFAYHLTEDFVAEFNFGQTTAQESSIEVLGGGIQLLTDDQRELSYYNISLAYNLFQGEVFFGENTAFNNTFHILVGGGNTTFNENDYFTYTLGGGLRFYLTDWIALHATVKNHIFDNDIIETKTTNNLEASLGFSIYF